MSEFSTGLLNALASALGAGVVLDPADVPSALTDYRGVHHGQAVAVVRPMSVEQVATAVRMCAKFGAAVVTQGGNTGLVGGSVPVGDGTERAEVVILLSRLDKIESISVGDSTIVAEAGATVEAVQRAASSRGMSFSPDWGARGSATVGGAISTNAGGINVLAHGSMRSHVLGLEVVLPDGRIWNGLRALRKDSSGYDLKHLFIGAEGTLGIITRATLALGTATSHRSTAMAAIRSTADLPEMMAMARAATNGTLTALELIPEIGLAAVIEKHGRSRPLSARSDWYLLIRYEGHTPVQDDLAAFLERAKDRGLILDAVVADTRRQDDELWLIRDELPPPGLLPRHDLAIKIDSAVPVDRIAEYIDEVIRTCARIAPKATPYIFGHVGDGNLHIHVLAPDDESSDFSRAKPSLVHALDELAWSLGGTISAEHGIGRELRSRIVGQKPPIEFELMRAIKTMIDPSDTMNPGKTIPPEIDA